MSVSELFKDTRLPVLAAPLFIISYPELVIAQCKAGVIGSFPALNARPAEELEKWINFKPNTSIDEGVKNFIKWYLSYIEKN